jgi:hypothetical protein
MPSRVRIATKKVQRSSLPVAVADDAVFVVVHEEGGGGVQVIRRSDITSKKLASKLVGGDAVSFQADGRVNRAIVLLTGKTCRLFFLYIIVHLNSGDQDDCNKTIEVMKRAKTASNHPSSTRTNTSARRIHRSPFTPDETQPDQDHEEDIDGCESEKDESEDNDNESPLVLASNESRSMGNTPSPSPVLPTATNDVSPQPTTGLTNNTPANMDRRFVCCIF